MGSMEGRQQQQQTNKQTNKQTKTKKNKKKTRRKDISSPTPFISLIVSKYSVLLIYRPHNVHFSVFTIRHLSSRIKFHINNVIYFRIHCYCGKLVTIIGVTLTLCRRVDNLIKYPLVPRRFKFFECSTPKCTVTYTLTL
jgi:hypothetical protein